MRVCGLLPEISTTIMSVWAAGGVVTTVTEKLKETKNKRRHIFKLALAPPIRAILCHFSVFMHILFYHLFLNTDTSSNPLPLPQGLIKFSLGNVPTHFLLPFRPFPCGPALFSRFPCIALSCLRWFWPCERGSWALCYVVV